MAATNRTAPVRELARETVPDFGEGIASVLAKMLTSRSKWNAEQHSQQPSASEPSLNTPTPDNRPPSKPNSVNPVL